MGGRDSDVDYAMVAASVVAGLLILGGLLGGAWLVMKLRANFGGGS